MISSVVVLLSYIAVISAVEVNVSSSTHDAWPSAKVRSNQADNEPLSPAIIQSLSMALSGKLADPQIPQFAPEVPREFLEFESENSTRVVPTRVLIIRGTEFGNSAEHIVSRSDKPKHHFLRQSELAHSLDEDYGISEGLSNLVSSAERVAEALPTHPVVEQVSAKVDTWAQETRAGFMGYLEKLSLLWETESESVGNKLYEAADAYSHRFFTLVHVKETDHPVLAAKVTRIIVAMGLSLSLVFVIFGVALHLQKSIVARAHEEASKQHPRIDRDREQLFFAMPYQHHPPVVAVE